MSLAIVGNSGGMKGVFVQGVLHALEADGLRADAYAGASASALPAVSAAAGLCQYVHIHYWQRVLRLLQEPGQDLSMVMRTVTREWDSTDEPFKRELFRPDRPRLFIPANHVKTESAAATTQSDKSRRLGRLLLLDIARHDRTWVDENLELHLFDTQSGPYQITPENLSDIAYASTRMIQWRVPAWIEERPYVDASYTCACPAWEIAQLGFTEIITISTESDDAYRDIFADTALPDELNGIPIHIIRPDRELTEMGVDFTTCTDDGLVNAFQHGQEQGQAFLSTWHQ